MYLWHQALRHRAANMPDVPVYWEKEENLTSKGVKTFILVQSVSHWLFCFFKVAKDLDLLKISCKQHMAHPI